MWAGTCRASQGQSLQWNSSLSVYKPIFVRRQWRRFALYRMRLSVRMRIHCGIGLFCFSFFASVFLTRNDLLHGMVAAHALGKD